VTTPDVNVVLRIRKLLALAHNNSNEFQAESALSKANELLLKHNLTLGDVEGSSTKVVKYVTEIKVNMHNPLQAWHKVLSTVIARHNFCLSIYFDCHLIFIGEITNLLATREMYSWAVSEINTRSRDQDESFRLGIVERLRGKLQGLRGRQVIGTKAVITAAIAEHVELNLAYVRKVYGVGVVKELELDVEIDKQSWQQGFEAAKDIQLLA
jgi:hypothetical protein